VLLVDTTGLAIGVAAGAGRGKFCTIIDRFTRVFLATFLSVFHRCIRFHHVSCGRRIFTGTTGEVAFIGLAGSGGAIAEKTAATFFLSGAELVFYAGTGGVQIRACDRRSVPTFFSIAAVTAAAHGK